MKQLVVDGQATVLDLITLPESLDDEIPYGALFDLMLKESDGLIVTYNSYDRNTFDTAVDRCRRLQTEFDSKGVEVPILLLGITASDGDTNRRVVSGQEVSEVARSLRAGYREIQMRRMDSVMGTVLSIKQPLIDISRMIQQAIEAFAGGRRGDKVLPTAK